jgi:hypothetical protein
MSHDTENEIRKVVHHGDVFFWRQTTVACVNIEIQIMGASRHVWSTQLLLVMVRARMERKRKAPATKLDAEVAASLDLLDVVEGLAEGESLIDVLLIDALHEIGKNSIVNKLKLLKGVLANAQKTVRSNAVKTSRANAESGLCTSEDQGASF